MKYLIDNDVFFAAIYSGHAGHEAARAWLDRAKPRGWGIAVETYLAALRLLMNPGVMGRGARGATQALDAIDAELSGKHPGEIVYAAQKPSRTMLIKAQGHKQVMDFWLVQIANEKGCKLVTNDAGILGAWPDDAIALKRP